MEDKYLFFISLLAFSHNDFISLELGLMNFDHNLRSECFPGRCLLPSSFCINVCLEVDILLNGTQV